MGIGADHQHARLGTVTGEFSVQDCVLEEWLVPGACSIFLPATTTLQATGRGQGITYIKPLEVCHLELLLGALACIHKSANLRNIVQFGLNAVIPCEPETIIAVYAGSTNSVVHAFHALSNLSIVRLKTGFWKVEMVSGKPSRTAQTQSPSRHQPE
jgi:hypothetical protein